MPTQIPNQINYQSNQNFDIDINSVYSDFIKSIDAIRSYTNSSTISDQTATSIFTSGDPTLAKLKTQVSTLSSYQESRCHAFYRIIGFPVVSSDFQYYNPGFNIVYDKNNTIGAAASDKKLSIAGNPISGFRNLSIKRENYVNNMLNIFSVPTTIDAGALALSVFGRLNNATPFSIPVTKSSAPFDTITGNQQYSADLSGRVGPNTMSLTQYLDVNGNTPLAANLQPLRTHLIKPFIVDPVIDFTVNDASRLVGVPFVPDKTYLMVKDGVYVNRPIIEQVITDRFTVADQADSLGTADTSVINYIKSIQAIKDDSIVNQVTSGDVYKLSEQTQFAKFLNIIQAMAISLVAARLTILQAQSKYYWVPVPNIAGPENGLNVQGVFLSTNITPDFVTAADQSIIQAKLRVTVNQINAQTAQISSNPDKGGFAFDNFKNNFGTDTTSSLGDIGTQSLQKLTDIRNNDLRKANDALRTVEIIMGEFSGLGLCDIIAVMGSLYIMPKESLLGFLDSDAILRMNKKLNLNETSPGINKAMADLTNTVQGFYNIMDQIYQDITQNNGL
jgi:hypothetical protein